MTSWRRSSVERSPPCQAGVFGALTDTARRSFAGQLHLLSLGHHDARLRGDRNRSGTLLVLEGVNVRLWAR